MNVKIIKPYQDLFEGTVVQDVIETDCWYRGVIVIDCVPFEVDVPKEYCVEI